MQLDLHVRKAALEDADALWALENDPDRLRFSFPSTTVGRDDHRRRLARQLASPDSSLWVCVSRGAVVARAGYAKVRSDAAMLEFVVAPGSRRSGVATWLLERSTPLAAAELGAATVFVTVFADNVPSLATLAKLGFNREGDGAKDGRPFLLLSKKLSPA